VSTSASFKRTLRLYRRPVGWLIGEDEIELNDAEPLFRAAAALSQEDKEQVLRFAEFLAAAGKPGVRTRRAAPGTPPNEAR